MYYMVDCLFKIHWVRITRVFDRRGDVWTWSPWRDDEEMIHTDVLWMWNSSDADLRFRLRFSSCFIQLLLESQISESESKQHVWPNASVGSHTIFPFCL